MSVVRPGLLYAGTENGFYISFNQGQLWQPFQSNLPVTPITDLVVKDNDLVASTSGRGFWILDDLSSLQQSGGVPDTTTLQLFAPKTTHRFTLGGGFEKGGNNGKTAAGGMTAIVGGMLFLSVQMWVGPTHIFDGVNLADYFHTQMLISGSALFTIGLGLLVYAILKSSTENEVVLQDISISA